VIRSVCNGELIRSVCNGEHRELDPCGGVVGQRHVQTGEITSPYEGAGLRA
jgi:hypothetical protein